MELRRFMPWLVVAAGLLAYHNSFTGPFIYDDILSITDNPTIRRLWPIWQPLSPPHRGGLTVESRPLINLSLAINYALGGQKVWGYHAVNLSIHILAGLTLLGVVRRTLLQPRLRERFGAAANGLALAIALLWTVHPLQTESVTYVIQRAESMMGLFYLLTLYCFIRGAESSRPDYWYGLCVGACALGMACKEVMASAPLMVMLYDRIFVSGSCREAWRRRRPLYLALAGTWVLLGSFLVLSFGNAFTSARDRGIRWWEYLLTEPGVMLHYLRLSLWPHPLCFDYYGWPMTMRWTSFLPSALVIAILLGGTAWGWKTNSTWAFLGSWFFLILAPSSSFVPADSFAYEHRMYLPLAAVVSLAVLTTARLLRGVPAIARVALAGVVVVIFGALTVARNNDYRSDEAIWRDAVTKRPNNVRATVNLGTALAHAGRMDEALPSYRRALALEPDNADVHFNIGVTLADHGDKAEALTHLREAVRIVPHSAEAHYSLGVVLAQQNEWAEALEQLTEAVRLCPTHDKAQNELGVALAHQGQVEDALPHFRQALRLDRGNEAARRHLAAALTQLGRTNEAERAPVK